MSSNNPSQAAIEAAKRLEADKVWLIPPDGRVLHFAHAFDAFDNERGTEMVLLNQQLKTLMPAVQQQTKRIQELEACVAEMREKMSEAFGASWTNDDSPDGVYFVPAAIMLDLKQLALDPDCGKDWVRRSEAEAQFRERVKPLVVYLAARYSRREELCEYREQLRALGYTVQARWLDGKHQLSDNGVPIGDSGEALVEGVDDGSIQVRNAELRAKFAQDDWEDVTNATVVINFTEPPRSNASRGGRHVECGIGLATKAKVIVVGYRENIFHWLPQVEFCSTWEQAKQAVAHARKQGWCE